MVYCLVQLITDPSILLPRQRPLVQIRLVCLGCLSKTHALYLLLHYHSSVKLEHGLDIIPRISTLDLILLLRQRFPL